MAGRTFEDLIEQVKALSHVEQHRLRDLLDTWLVPASATPSEDEFEQELLDTAGLDHVPPPAADPVPYQQWKPIEVQGQPVSESLIEERR